MVVEESENERARVLRGRVNALFALCHPPDRGPYSNYEAAERARERGHEISATAIQQFRQGSRPNPTFRLLMGIAAALEVSVTDLVSDEDPRGLVTRAAGGELSEDDAATALLMRALRKLVDESKSGDQ